MTIIGLAVKNRNAGTLSGWGYGRNLLVISALRAHCPPL
jgi:hypothetical protein